MSNIFKIKHGSDSVNNTITPPTTTDLEEYELGFGTNTNTLYINNGTEVVVPFARVKANNINGVLDASQIPNLAASKITSGTLPVARGGTGQTSIANIQAGKDGNGNTINSTYLKLSGGTMTGNIVFENNNIGIQRVGRSVSWNKGRDSAIIKTTSLNGYGALASIKTNNGSWDIGAYNNASFTDDLLFTYVTDTQYNGTSAVSTAQIKILENGHIVGTLDGNATNVTGVVAVANGGTGATSLDSAGIVTKSGSQTISGAKTFSNNITMSEKNLGLKFVDSSGATYWGIIDNGHNLWVGAQSGSATPHVGGTYISTGLSSSSTTATGNPSIYISIPRRNGTTYSHSSYEVFHKGNLTYGTGNPSGGSNGDIYIKYTT